MRQNNSVFSTPEVSEITMVAKSTSREKKLQGEARDAPRRHEVLADDDTHTQKLESEPEDSVIVIACSIRP